MTTAANAATTTSTMLWTSHGVDSRRPRPTVRPVSLASSAMTPPFPAPGGALTVDHEVGDRQREALEGRLPRSLLEPRRLLVGPRHDHDLVRLERAERVLDRRDGIDVA